jgi:hypothetical protein
MKLIGGRFSSSSSITPADYIVMFSGAIRGKIDVPSEFTGAFPSIVWLSPILWSNEANSSFC